MGLRFGGVCGWEAGGLRSRLWTRLFHWLPGEKKSTQLQMVVKSICQRSNVRVGRAELWPREAASQPGKGGSVLLSWKRAEASSRLPLIPFPRGIN